MLMKRSNISDFLILVTIENKRYVSDPEGETILRDLVVFGKCAKNSEFSIL